MLEPVFCPNYSLAKELDLKEWKANALYLVRTLILLLGYPIFIQ